MNLIKKIAVCSRSFSRNKTLCDELLKKYDNVVFNDKGLSLHGDSLIGFLQGATHAIVALEKIDATILSKLPDLEVISKYGVGLDMIDINAMNKYSVKLGWTGGVNRRSVSELVIAFSISLLRHVPAAHKEVLSGIWKQHIGGHLSGRTVGIIGCGFVGKDLIKLLQSFGCNILANDIRNYDKFYKKYNVKSVSKEELLAKSDIVTLHTPLNNSTRNMLNSERLSIMNSNAILINVARGGLVDEVALKNMLISKEIAAAAFDVFTVEPPEDLELINLDNFLVTPHIGGSSQEAILAMGMAAIDGINNNSSPRQFLINT
ncbi:phosphoglycerate dehydrogenase [bacterium]|nr:phosphoglycerate dehydrogenase [bacterium]